MGKPPDNIIKLPSETLLLCEYTSGAYKGFWLYDKTRSMNLSMRAKTETEAFAEALHGYQKRLKEVEEKYAGLEEKVDAFVSQFTEEEDDEE